MKKWNLSLIVVLITSVNMAAEQKEANKETRKTQPVQEAPKVSKGYVPQSEITITESKDSLIKEYRIEGQIRAIKVTPKNGFPAYYLVDESGTGEFIKFGPDMGPEMKVPQWILFEW